MRTIQILCCVAVAIIGLARASWGDGEGEALETIGDPVDDTTEPITGQPVVPNPGSEQPMRDPFTPYEIGDVKDAWRIDDLTPDEQDVALRGVDGNPQRVQDAYAAAARGLAERARGKSAAGSLQFDQLATLGVVP